ncbi:MAG: MATE family efflux transporter [Clostridia bacterium]|nr:MATE family efflux transporter [Clostridia bacterium]
MVSGQKKFRDYTEGAILPQLAGFVIPLIVTGVLQLLFNTADIIVVGRWGGNTPEECETALAAVGSCGALITLLINLFIGLSIGSGVVVANDMGAKKYDDVSRTVHTSVLTALVCGVGATVIGILFARPLLSLMGTEDVVMEQAVPYMRAYFCGAIANILYNYCASMLRSTGDTVRPLLFLSAAGVLNVVLNLVMVLVFHLGAIGVGIATAASHWLSCSLIIGFMIRTDGPCHLDIRKLHIHKDKLKRLLAIGIPAGLQGMLFSISNVLIQSSVNSLGKAVVAGNAAAANVEGYLYTVQNSFYQATLTFVGQNVGAQNYKRVRQCILRCALSVALVGLVLGNLIRPFGESLLSLYAPENPAAIAAGMKRVNLTFPVYFLLGLMETGSGLLRGLGKSLTSTLVSLIGSCALRVVWVYTVFAAMPTIEVLYLSYPISWGLTAATHYTLGLSSLHRRRKREEKPESEESLLAAVQE